MTRYYSEANSSVLHLKRYSLRIITFRVFAVTDNRIRVCYREDFSTRIEA
jgi:hypothetical protein